MAENKAPVQITQRVFDQFMEVRDIGACNMFDREGVQYVANSIDAWDLVLWLEDHKKEYSQLVFGNFEIVEEA